MKIIVVYRSTYGSSLQYAKWIGEELKAKVKQGNHVSLKELLSYDVIIYIGGLYAGGVNGFRKIRKNLDVLKNKKLLLCMVGMTNPAEQEKYQEVFNKNVPEQYRYLVKPFALRGNQLFSKMSPVHKLMMKVPKAMTEKIPEEQRTEENRLFIESFGKDTRFVHKEYINDVVKYVNSLK